MNLQEPLQDPTVGDLARYLQRLRQHKLALIGCFAVLVLALISIGAPENELRESQRLHSSGSLFDNALHKAIKGITTVEEALRFDVSSM